MQITKFSKLAKAFFSKLLIILLSLVSSASSENLKECSWDQKNRKPCITINKSTPNTSQISALGVNKIVLSSKEISDSGALDLNSILKLIPGINITQSGPMGQQASLFTRGTGSNHTLVLLNGIAINDQSTTQGLHDFGVDFVQNIQQVEVYLGPNGAHFGPSAIGGAINIITASDFKNKINIKGYNNKNNSISTNFTNISKNDWIFNFKGGSTKSRTESARYGGSEKDGVKNFNTNINLEKWVNDNIKFRATAFGRQTVSAYDSSPTIEEEYTGDNTMFASQLFFERNEKNFNDVLTFHFHNYDRKYRENGTLDEYDSSAYKIRTERKLKLNNKISIGFGAEYNYDWGEFNNRGSSYSASTKGHVYNSGFFTNIGYNFFDNTTLSFYGRSDEHKTTGLNNTYKINLSQYFNKFQFGTTHSTGLRNPSLYELYGSDSTGYSGNLNLKPEKAKSNEIFGKLKFSKNLLFSLTMFKTNIYDHVEYENKSYKNNSTKIDLNQSGIESGITWKKENQKLTLFGTSLSSKKTDGSDQLRRPEKKFGLNYDNKFFSNLFGEMKISANYQHYGKHWDTHSSNWTTILMDSTDIANLRLSKKIFGQNWSLNINNMFDEGYQRPHGYMQNGRQIRFGFERKY